MVGSGGRGCRVLASQREGWGVPPCRSPSGHLLPWGKVEIQPPTPMCACALQIPLCTRTLCMHLPLASHVTQMHAHKLLGHADGTRAPPPGQPSHARRLCDCSPPPCAVPWAHLTHLGLGAECLCLSFTPIPAPAGGDFLKGAGAVDMLPRGTEGGGRARLQLGALVDQPQAPGCWRGVGGMCVEARLGHCPGPPPPPSPALPSWELHLYFS